MKSYHFKIAAYIILLSFSSCEGLFILDPIDPRLPKYTHAGNSTAGALINNEQWKSVVEWHLFGAPSHKPSFIRYPNDSLVITFYGTLKSEHKVSIHFSITGLEIDEFNNLTKLKGIKIPLNGTTGTASLSTYSESCQEVSGGIGQFYARDITVRESGSMIFSGTFGFVIEDEDCGTIEVSYGRFDYVVSQSHFNIYPG
ncbi:MAG: hypothetical protein KF845_09640 [Cyclobacteriaceae bacterium]|nr:hypothetical protein [Cyclobacteriaceae bacterium]